MPVPETCHLSMLRLSSGNAVQRCYQLVAKVKKAVGWSKMRGLRMLSTQLKLVERERGMLFVRTLPKNMS